MTSLVCFRAGEARYAVTVGDAASILAFEGVEALPDPRQDVLGLLRTGGAALPVLAPFGARAGEHVVVLEADGQRFGLLVDEVLAVVKVDPAAIEPAPAGQAQPVVRGVAGGAGAGALLLDPAVLAQRLAG